MGGCFRDLVACSERFPKVGETIIGKGFLKFNSSIYCQESIFLKLI